MRQYINTVNISKALIFTLLAVVFLFNFTFVNAQENTGRFRAEHATDTAKEKRIDAKEKFAEKKEIRKQKLNEKAKKRITAYVHRIIKRLNAALDRFEKIAERVGSRIEKLEDKFADRSLDLSPAKTLLKEAESEIAKARGDISSIEETLGEALNTDSPKESFTAVRELIKTAIESMRSAHRALVEAIKTVRAGVANENTEVEDN